MSEKKAVEKEDKVERKCARAICGEKGYGYDRCSRCKATYYCSRKCQAADWKENHKYKCEPWKPSGRETIDDQVVYDYVECETYDDCRKHLIKHPELINRELADEMFEKGWMALKTHPPQIGTRFIRNCQIINYLLDIRKASGGQQDINLFFGKIMDQNDPTYLRNFTNEYMASVKRILTKFQELKKKEAEQKGDKAPETDENNKQTAPVETKTEPAPAQATETKPKDSRVDELD